MMIFSTLVSPSIVLFIVASGLNFAYDWDNISTLVVLIVISIAYGAICLHKQTKKYKIVVAEALTLMFAVLMVIVVVGVVVKINQDVGKKNCVNYCKLSVSLGVRCEVMQFFAVWVRDMQGRKLAGLG